MALSSGIRLGPYEITDAIGEGGMGQVYKAKDVRLNRTVAIKVLPEHLAAAPEFRERFEREARSISALSHPNICTLYDIGRERARPADGEPTGPDVEFLVMEFLEGETLASRLSSGALPLAGALKLAVEIAGALDKAHRQGIVHRDLKPGNVMLTRTGAKLLDFGLAKIATAGAVSGAAPTALATSPLPSAHSPALTAQGTILGTVQYMAPEQVEGEEADARTDIFAFGAVLYESVSGKKAFTGKSQAGLLGAILKDEAPSVVQGQPAVPAALDHVIRTCLAKDPDARFQTAHDLLLQLRWIAEGSGVSGAAVAVASPTVARARPRLVWLVGGALVLAALAGAAGYLARPEPETHLTRFLVPLPDRLSMGESLAVSPNGRLVAFTGALDGRSGIWLRTLESVQPTRLAGTDGAVSVFWSPDSATVAFFAEGKLKRIPIAGGPAQTICDAVNGKGGTWNRDNVIVFSPTTPGGLSRVPAAGGTPVVLTDVDEKRQEQDHRWPVFLPDGRHFLYLSRNNSVEKTAIMVASLDDPKHPKTLVDAGSNALYAPAGVTGSGGAAGYLLFLRERSLMAQPFDPGTLALSGDAAPVAEQVGLGAGNAFLGAFTASTNGVLVFGSGAPPNRQLAWFDRAGKDLGHVGPVGQITDVSLSLDGTRAAVRVLAQNNSDIWTLDLVHPGAALSRLTFAPSNEAAPVWSPDGSHIAYFSTRDGPQDVYQKLSSGVGTEELVLKTTRNITPSDWSRDGRYLLYWETDPKTSADLWVLPLTGDRKPTVYLQTEANEAHARFSPDGKWIAYTSTETGAAEVYVQSFPASGAKYQISNAGGARPMWRNDGAEIFYVTPDRRVMAVPVKTGATFEYGSPTALFAADIDTYTNQRVAVAPDGRRFLVNAPAGAVVQTPFTVVLNWAVDLRRR